MSQRTILIVEDDPEQLHLIDLTLSEPSWHKLMSESGLAALQLAARHGRPIDLLLTDVVMADLNGCALAARLRGQYPQMRVRYMSGYGAEILAKYGVGGDAHLLIKKPFSAEALRERIREALEENQ